MIKRATGLRTKAIRLFCLTIAILTAATTAVALAKQNGEPPAAAIERTPQAAIDETFAILRTPALDSTRPAPVQSRACSNFNAAFLDAKCATTVHKKRAGRSRRVATFVAGRVAASE
jgi:hypothetical protein